MPILPCQMWKNKFFFFLVNQKNWILWLSDKSIQFIHHFSLWVKWQTEISNQNFIFWYNTQWMSIFDFFSIQCKVIWDKRIPHKKLLPFSITMIQSWNIIASLEYSRLIDSVRNIVSSHGQWYIATIECWNFNVQQPIPQFVFDWLRISPFTYRVKFQKGLIMILIQSSELQPASSPVHLSWYYCNHMNNNEV